MKEKRRVNFFLSILESIRFAKKLYSRTIIHHEANASRILTITYTLLGN